MVQLCPAGSKCPLTTSGPVACERGHFSADGAVNCTECTAGFFCSATEETLCPVGTWSAPGSSGCELCSGGYACTAETRPHISATPAAVECTQGGWCNGAARFLCPNGFFGNVTGASTQAEGCYRCPPGYFCNRGPESNVHEPQPCVRGYYCPAGTKFGDEFPCPAGTYSPETVSGVRDSVSTGCLLCTNGSYCLQGFTVPLPCPRGFYCPAGTDHQHRFPCPLGTFGDGTGFEEAGQCPQCPPGHYCPSGNQGSAPVSALPCPGGTYNPLPGTGSEHNCLQCPAGMSCPNTEQVAAVDPCAEGYYCPLGTVTAMQFPCPPGTFTGSTNLTAAEECTICPAGKQAGKKVPGAYRKPEKCRKA